MRCRVIVERPHAAHQSGNGCRALVRAIVPGAEVVGRALENGDGDESAAIAIAEAFRAVERQLASRSARSHGGRRPPDRRAPKWQGLFDAA